METGFFLDVASDKYHAGPGLSRSNIIDILRSPAHYRYPDPDDQEPTDALLWGDAFHVYCLQPHLFESQFIVAPPDLDGRTKVGKIIQAGLEATGKKVLKADWMHDIRGMYKSLMSNPEIQRIMSVGQPELTGYWYDSLYTDVLCKLRLDWFNSSTGEVLDIKSTRDARKEPFTRDAYQHGYHIQVGHYLEGVQTITKASHDIFYFAAVEKKKPNYAVKLYRATRDFRADGFRAANLGIRTYKDCRDRDSWPAYGPDIAELDLPPWKKRTIIDHIIE